MKNKKRYVKIVAILMMLVMCSIVAEARMPWCHHQPPAPPTPTEKIIVPFSSQDCDSPDVHTYQCCAIKFTIPCGVSSITSIRGIFSKITNQCSGALVSGFSKTLTTDESKWSTHYTTNNVGSSIMTGKINFNCCQGQTWYYIWYTTGCSYMIINYGMSQTSHSFSSYIYNNGFQLQPNNFLLEIKGMSL